MAHLHEHAVLHRDLKADNVLVDEAGHVRLADLNVAKRLVPASATAAADASTDNDDDDARAAAAAVAAAAAAAAGDDSTRTYTMVGTVYATAPEVLLGKGWTRASDWWSYGVLLFEMLAGRPGDSVEIAWRCT